MPRPTFENLPASKRDALVQTALEEFAAHDYDSASVSRIVSRAGIAKGSLYQYFDDKQDLFLYLVAHAQQVMLAALGADPPPDPSAGFFTTLRWQMSATVRAALAYPIHSRLLRRAYAAALPFRDRLLDQARSARHAHVMGLVQRGIERGELDPSIRPDVAALVVEAVLSEIGPFLLSLLGLDPQPAEAADSTHFDSPQVEAAFDSVLAVLRRGLER